MGQIEHSFSFQVSLVKRKRERKIPLKRRMNSKWGREEEKRRKKRERKSSSKRRS